MPVAACQYFQIHNTIPWEAALVALDIVKDMLGSYYHAQLLIASLGGELNDLSSNLCPSRADLHGKIFPIPGLDQRPLQKPVGLCHNNRSNPTSSSIPFRVPPH